MKHQKTLELGIIIKSEKNLIWKTLTDEKKFIDCFKTIAIQYKTLEIGTEILFDFSELCLLNKRQNNSYQ